MSCRWSVPSAHAVEWRSWGDDVVVFCHDTGATHLLTDAACAVFAQLIDSQGQVTTQDLLDLLGSPTADGGEETIRSEMEYELVQHTLASLEDIRLIRRHT